MKKNAYFLAIASALLLASATLFGCGPKNKMYAWGNYSKTLYHCKKNPTEEKNLAHRKELLRIMAESEEHNMRVPPGVCAEYAYLLMKEGNMEEANRYLDREEKEYPESKQLVTFVRSMMKGESD